MKPKHLLYILLCLQCLSCEEVLEYDFENSERHVVVNGLPCADSTLFVNLTYSRFFLDNQPFVPVEDATVTLSVDGAAPLDGSRNGANWSFNYVAHGGEVLTLHVSIPGRDAITAQTHVPALPDMTTPTAEIDTLQPIDAGDILFTLNDPADEQNYYYIYVHEHDSGTRWNRWEQKWDTIDTVVYAYFNCLDLQISDPSVNVTTGLFGYFSRLMFSDSLIDGTLHDMKISLVMPKDTAEHPLQREYTLVVESLSPEAFRYHKDLIATQSITQYFAEPSQVYSNIQGALGIFAGIAKRSYPLTFVYKEQPSEPPLGFPPHRADRWEGRRP